MKLLNPVGTGQTTPLTVTPVTVTLYSYSDSFFSKKNILKLKIIGYNDSPLIVTV